MRHDRNGRLLARVGSGSVSFERQFLNAWRGRRAVRTATAGGEAAGKARGRSTMTINLQKPDITELKPRITVFGVGGAGGNAVNNMITRGPRGRRVRRRQHRRPGADHRPRPSASSRWASHVTEGLGAGSQPEVGRAAAEEVHRRDHRSPRRRAHGASSPPAWAAAPAPALRRSSPAPPARRAS